MLPDWVDSDDGSRQIDEVWWENTGAIYSCVNSGRKIENR